MKALWTVICFCAVISCGKSGNDTPGPGQNPNPGGEPSVQLVINTVVPASAEFVPVTISGTGFNLTAANNVVKIGGLNATVTQASATQLVITLPAALAPGDHDIVVTANAKTATKARAFHLQGWVVENYAGNGDLAQEEGIFDMASFRMPSGIAMDLDGNMYVADFHMIRKIQPNGQVINFAGGTAPGYVNGLGRDARFDGVNSIAVDVNNNLYVTDLNNHRVRKIDPNGTVSDCAGSGFGYEDGAAASAKFKLPYGIAIDRANNFLYVGDQGNHRVRRIDLRNANAVTTYAGDGTAFRKDGVGTAAGIPSPGGLKFDVDGNLMVVEKGGGRIRKITSNVTVSTVGGFSEEQNMTITPTHLSFDSDNNMYVSFTDLGKIRRYNTAGSYTDFSGLPDGPQREDGALNTVTFRKPAGIVTRVNAQGNLEIFVADQERRKIKRIVRI